MNWPLVFGLGSHFGDDQAGWLIVTRLRDLGYPASHLRQIGHPADLLDEFTKSDHLIVCDACHGTGFTGTIHTWKWPTVDFELLSSRGTHDLGLGSVLELATQLGTVPNAIEIWGIEGTTWQSTTTTDERVSAAARHVAATIWSRYSHA